MSVAIKTQEGSRSPLFNVLRVAFFRSETNKLSFHFQCSSSPSLQIKSQCLLHTSDSYFCPQGLQYHRFELRKNSDPSNEQSEQLTGALTVHPVSDPDQMYRLHRFFTEIELHKAYSEIVKLQVS